MDEALATTDPGSDPGDLAGALASMTSVAPVPAALALPAAGDHAGPGGLARAARPVAVPESPLVAAALQASGLRTPPNRRPEPR